MMQVFFTAILTGILLLTIVMVVLLCRGPGVYDRFVATQAIGTNVILVLLLIGCIDGRQDMYVDIAIAYAVLGFISSIILAKFMGTRGGKRRGE